MLLWPQLLVVGHWVKISVVMHTFLYRLSGFTITCGNMHTNEIKVFLMFLHVMLRYSPFTSKNSTDYPLLPLDGNALNLHFFFRLYIKLETRLFFGQVFFSKRISSSLGHPATLTCPKA